MKILDSKEKISWISANWRENLKNGENELLRKLLQEQLEVAAKHLNLQDNQMVLVGSEFFLMIAILNREGCGCEGRDSLHPFDAELNVPLNGTFLSPGGELQRKRLKTLLMMWWKLSAKRPVPKLTSVRLKS